MDRKQFKVVEVNVIFLILAIVFITFGASVQRWDIHKGLLITEYVIIFLPVILAGKLLNVDLKSALKLNPIKGRTILSIIWLSFLILPAVAVANLIPITVLSFFGKVMIPSIPSPDSAATFALSFFIISISPGICEEVFFRGMILNAYETTFNKKIGAIIAAVLFGIFHFNIQNLFGPIIVGLAAAYIMQITNSLYAAIMLHMTNNGLAVIMDYVSGLYATEVVDTAAATADLNANPFSLVLTVFMLGAIAFIGLFFAMLLIKGVKRDTFYFAHGEPFVAQDETYYLVQKERTYGKIISKKEAFKEGVYNLSAERSISWKALNAMGPERIHEIWEDGTIKETLDKKVYAPLIGVAGLYLYILYLFLTY